MRAPCRASPSPSPSSSSHNNHRRSVTAAAGPSSPNPVDAFAQLEALLTAAAQAGGSSGDRGWREAGRDVRPLHSQLTFISHATHSFCRSREKIK